MARRETTAPRAWQRMLSGRRLDLLDPSPLDVEIEDVAHGLARVARWNGQTSGPHIFSVAQHSLLVEAIAQHIRSDLPARTALAVLLHDAAEYVIGDMISPFKAVIGPSYKDVEHRILSAIMIRFGLPATMSREVAGLAKQADRIAAHHEAVTLAGFAEEEASRFFGAFVHLPADIRDLLAPMGAEDAKLRLLTRFAALSGTS